MPTDNLNPPDPDNLPVDAAKPEELPAEHQEADERTAAPSELDDESSAEPLASGIDAEQDS